MAKRVRKCWIVEVKTHRGWEPCYVSEVHSSRELSDGNLKRLQASHRAGEYRIAQYAAVPRGE